MQYHFNELTFDASRNALTRETSTVTLSENVAILLKLFIANSGKPLTKDELKMGIWGHDNYDHNTLRNLINNLRRELGTTTGKPCNFIKTIPQVGYEWVATTTTLDNELEKPLLPKAKNTTRTAVILVSTILILITLISSFFLNSTNLKSDTSAASIKLIPVTHERGQEWSPSLSPLGKFLVYVHRANHLQHWQINIKDMTRNISRPLLSEQHKLDTPTWSSDGKSIYYTKSVNNNCEIWKLTLNTAMEVEDSSRIHTCGNIESMSPIALDNHDEWLYFSKIIDRSHFIIARYNLLNGIEEELTTAGSTGFGDYSLTISPDNSFIAFLRNIGGMQRQILVLNLESQEIRKLVDFNHVLYRITWDLNSENIFFINKENMLSKVNIYDGMVSNIYQFNERKMAPHYTSENQFIVDGSFFITEAIAMQIDSQEDYNYRVVASSSYSDYAPTPSHDEQFVAFNSMRTGIEQIWLYSGDELNQITHFKQSNKLSNKKISPNKEHLLFLKNQYLHILEFKSGNITPLVSDIPAKSPIWSCDGQNIYTVLKVNHSHNLYQIDFHSNNKRKLLSNVRSVKQDCLTGKLYILQSNSKALFEFNSSDNSIRDLGLEVNVNFSRKWEIQQGVLFQLIENKIAKTDLKSKQIKQLELPSDSFDHFSYANNQFYLSRKKLNETSIKQMVSIK